MMSKEQKAARLTAVFVIPILSLLALIIQESIVSWIIVGVAIAVAVSILIHTTYLDILRIVEDEDDI